MSYPESQLLCPVAGAVHQLTDSNADTHSSLSGRQLGQAISFAISLAVRLRQGHAITKQ